MAAWRAGPSNPWPPYAIVSIDISATLNKLGVPSDSRESLVSWGLALNPRTDWLEHARKAQEFRQQAERTSDPLLRQKYLRVADLHARIAEKLKAIHKEH
jgi:hypothetical protein